MEMPTSISGNRLNHTWMFQPVSIPFHGKGGRSSVRRQQLPEHKTACKRLHAAQTMAIEELARDARKLPSPCTKNRLAVLWMQTQNKRPASQGYVFFSTVSRGGGRTVKVPPLRVPCFQ